MQPRAQGSLAQGYNPATDPGWAIVREDPELTLSAKLAWLALREMAGGKPATVRTTPTAIGASYGREKRSGLEALNTLIEAGLVELTDSRRQGEPVARGLWALYVGDPAELQTARRRASDAQKPLIPESAGHDDGPADAGEKTVPFSPRLDETALSVLREEEKSLSPSPSGPLGTFSTSEPSVPLETTGALAIGPVEIGAVAIGGVMAGRAAAVEDGTHDAYYVARRERRIAELVRRVGDKRLKLIVAVRVAAAEQLGTINVSETEGVLAWMDELRRTEEGLPVPSQAFVGTMKKVFHRNKVDWVTGKKL